MKTAIAGEDANWGRIVMAVGKAGEPADRDRLAICFGDIRVAAQGARDPAYDEAACRSHHEGRGHRRSPSTSASARRGDRVDLRPHQGLRRDQRRLPELIRRMILSGAMTITAPDLAPATAAERPLSVAVVRTTHDVLDCLIGAQAASPV